MKNINPIQTVVISLLILVCAMQTFMLNESLSKWKQYSEKYYKSLNECGGNEAGTKTLKEQVKGMDSIYWKVCSENIKLRIKYNDWKTGK